MYDKELALELLEQVHESAEIILKRFQPIRSPSPSPALSASGSCRRPESHHHQVWHP